MGCIMKTMLLFSIMQPVHIEPMWKSKLLWYFNELLMIEIIILNCIKLCMQLVEKFKFFSIHCMKCYCIAENIIFKLVA